MWGQVLRHVVALILIALAAELTEGRKLRD